MNGFRADFDHTVYSHHMRNKSRLLSLAVVLVGAVVAGAGSGQAASSSKNVSISHRQFEPRELTVEVGQQVTWTNKDPGQVHSVTADDGSFDSGPNCSDANPGACLDDRDQFQFTFSTAGTFPYYSRTNGGPGGQGTSGVITVVASGTPTPATTATTAAPAP